MLATSVEPAAKPSAELFQRLAHPSDDDVAALEAWWRANNYLTVGQIYLLANPLLRTPLRAEPQLQWMTIEDAVQQCEVGGGVWQWAGNEHDGADPDIVLACAGDVVTMETVAAAEILKAKLPDLSTRVVNVVNLMSLPLQKVHPNGMDETVFSEIFTDEVDVLFAFHGYPGAVHQMIHGRPHPGRFHVRGFIEEGTTTTPFDMVVRNRASRYQLVIDALNNAKRTTAGAAELQAWCEEQLERHRAYVIEHLQDMPEVRDWRLGQLRA